MGIIPGPLITGPQPLRTRYGLLTAATGPMDLPTPHGRGGGVRFVPESCGSATPFAITCTAGSINDPTKFADAETPEFDALPFGVYASIECGALGYTGAEFENKVRQRLFNGEQHAVEQALWTGNDAGFGITRYLAATTDNVTVPDETSIISVVSAMEDWLYNDNEYGYEGYIHAPVSVAAHAAAWNLVVKDGPLLRTPYGTVWVFGGGYPGTGALGAAPPLGGAYMHITGQTTVWRSRDVWVYPADQTMNRTTNQRLLIAEREYAVAFECENGRALFNPLGGS